LLIRQGIVGVTLKVYIAGKVSKDSSFRKHHWRDEFCEKISELSGRKLHNLDPSKIDNTIDTPEAIFGADVELISQCDVLVVYLSDDISVGGSQEILIAKYLNKPVIGYAPYGGKFNGCRREHFGRVIEDFKDPFVFATCDVVCGNLEETGMALKSIEQITPKGIDIIDNYREIFLNCDNDHR
jgi:nucleoside 2-deoxyribosyltransferase